MALFPKSLISKLYNRTSLRNTGRGVSFSVKNRLSPATLIGIRRVVIGEETVEAARVSIQAGDRVLSMAELSEENPVDFPLGALLRFSLDIAPLSAGRHEIRVDFRAKPFGKMVLKVEDALNTGERTPGALPRDAEDDYSEAVISDRQTFIRERTGQKLEHLPSYSFDPHVTQGNIEHFTGVAQIPMGFAGPLKVNGEHAQGEYYVPLATTEGTLVASYNRGMKVLHQSGGVKCAVVADNMQRAPGFAFEDAASARDFSAWVKETLDYIRSAAEATDPFVKLDYIDHYHSNRFAFLRFNFKTGDAAGMNMVGKATFAACNWILQNSPVAIDEFFLEANFATDKKASTVNIMHTRGKRVTAEAVIKREVLRDIMDADTETMYRHYKMVTVGSMLSGATNNGAHAANGVTAMFIATGQDVANVSESSVGLFYCELTEDKDLYISITLPSLIVATCGGGTGLPTQRECLEALDCYGVGRVKKFAEIVAGTVLAGEISLAAAISSLDWVSSHDDLGRNDPLAKG